MVSCAIVAHLIRTRTYTLNGVLDLLTLFVQTLCNANPCMFHPCCTHIHTDIILRWKMTWCMHQACTRDSLFFNKFASEWFAHLMMMMRSGERSFVRLHVWVSEKQLQTFSRLDVSFSATVVLHRATKRSGQNRGYNKRCALHAYNTNTIVHSTWRWDMSTKIWWHFRLYVCNGKLISFGFRYNNKTNTKPFWPLFATHYCFILIAAHLFPRIEFNYLRHFAVRLMETDQRCQLFSAFSISTFAHSIGLW